jgi:hypothetical protein
MFLVFIFGILNKSSFHDQKLSQDRLSEFIEE